MIATPSVAALLTQLVSALAAQEASAVPQPPPLPEPRQLPPRVLLTVEEAAEQLGIGRTLTYHLVTSGQLKSVRIGRLRRIPVTAIADYAAALLASKKGE